MPRAFVTTAAAAEVGQAVNLTRDAEECDGGYFLRDPAGIGVLLAAV